MLKAFALRLARIRGLAQDGTVLTRGRYGSALFQSVGHCGSPPIVSARTDSLDRSTLRRRTLTLILSDSARLRELRRDRVVCACTHYPVFKEPTRLRRAAFLATTSARQAPGSPPSQSARIGSVADRV